MKRKWKDMIELILSSSKRSLVFLAVKIVAAAPARKTRPLTSFLTVETYSEDSAVSTVAERIRENHRETDASADLTSSLLGRCIAHDGFSLLMRFSYPSLSFSLNLSFHSSSDKDYANIRAVA